MTANLSRLVADALDFLTVLAREGARPAEARERISPLRQRHVGSAIELVWQEEPFDQSVHYDLLLRPDRAETISLSVCPARALPWPLRGARRSSELDIVRVNDVVMQISQAMACLDFIWDEARVMDRLVNACLIQQALNEEPIEITDDELQRGLDGFRRAHGLYDAADTRRWLEHHGMTHEQFERYVTDELLVAKVRERVAAGRVEERFERHRADYDRAHVAQFVARDEAAADETARRIRAGEVDFFEEAQRHWLAAGRRTGEESTAVFRSLRRRDVPAEFRDAVFSAAPGSVVGPVPVAEGSAVIRVLAIEPARLDDATRHAVARALFDEWLAERRRGAKVEWYWGNVNRTSR